MPPAGGGRRRRHAFQPLDRSPGRGRHLPASPALPWLRACRTRARREFRRPPCGLAVRWSTA